MKEFALDHFVGVFDGNMERVYRLVGASPTVVGRQVTSDGIIGVGLWEFGDAEYQNLLRKAGLSAQEMEVLFDGSFTPHLRLSKSA